MKPKNPSAFPLYVKNETQNLIFPGMTLRDYFAAQALPSVMNDWSRYSIPNRKFDFFMNGGDAENIAEQAYLLADSMLKQRENDAV